MESADQSIPSQPSTSNAQPQTCRKSVTTRTPSDPNRIEIAVRRIGQLPPAQRAPSPPRYLPTKRTNFLNAVRNLNPVEKRAISLRQTFNKRLDNYSQDKRQPGVGKGGVRRLAQALKKQHKQAEKVALIQLRQTERLCNEEPSIPMRPFFAIVKEIFANLNKADFRIQLAAVEVLRTEVEWKMANTFEFSYMLTRHASRSTLMPRDLHLTKALCKAIV